MDRSDRRLNEYVQRARLLDDDALVALGNRGLLRRARKDLERVAPTCEEPAGDVLPVSVDDARVELRLVPAASTCSCPASGPCRHLIAAWLHVGSLAIAGDTGEPAPAVDPLVGLLGIDDEALGAFAGRGMVRRAMAEVAAGLAVAADPSRPGLVRVAEWGVEVRFLSGTEPTASTCSCHAPAPCLHRVTAIVGLQVAHGVRTLDVEDAVSQASAGAVRDRSDLLEAVGEVLVDLLTIGLSRVSAAAVSRVQTLATSAHGVDLPRLERALRGLAGELRALHARDGSADAVAVVLRAAGLAALRDGLARGVPGLVGRHRARFARVGEIELAGVGAAAFRTRGGHRGLTCWFWDLKRGAWNTWSETRAEGTRGFDPLARFEATGPWPGCPSPRAATRSLFRLVGAWRSDGGRLSVRDGVRCVVAGPSDLTAVPSIGRWDELGEVARAAFGRGLADPPPHADVVVLRPVRAEPTRFDPVQQRLRTVLVDRDGERLASEVDYATLGETGVARLSAVPAARWGRVLARIRLRDGAIVAEPLTLLGGDGAWSPTIDGRADRVTAAPEGQLDAEARPDAGTTAWSRLDDPVGHAADELLQACVDLADRGTRTGHREADDALARTLVDELGWSALAPSWCDLRSANAARERADALLRFVFVLDLARRRWWLRRGTGR